GADVVVHLLAVGLGDVGLAHPDEVVGIGALALGVRGVAVTSGPRGIGLDAAGGAEEGEGESSAAEQRATGGARGGGHEDPFPSEAGFSARGWGDGAPWGEGAPGSRGSRGRQSTGARSVCTLAAATMITPLISSWTLESMLLRASTLLRIPSR